MKNFSLERMIHHRKHSGPLKEEELPQSPPSYIEPDGRTISDPAISNRKSLPADFRYENVANYLSSDPQVNICSHKNLYVWYEFQFRMENYMAGKC